MHPRPLIWTKVLQCVMRVLHDGRERLDGHARARAGPHGGVLRRIPVVPDDEPVLESQEA